MGYVLEVVGQPADQLVVVLCQAGEDCELLNEGAGGWAGGHGAARPGGQVGGEGTPEAPRVPEARTARRGHGGVCRLRPAGGLRAS